MDKISELKGILSGFLVWNKARLDCFTRMLVALFAVRTVNLKEVALAFPSQAQVDSRYKRLKRFFADFKFEQTLIMKWIFQLFFSHQSKVYLTLDRTNWFWGKSKINILLLGVAYEGIAIPLCWRLLDKAGNASAKEHQELIQYFSQILGKTSILGLLADREFASGDLLNWLNENNIPFYIRLKHNVIVRIRRHKLCKVEKLFNELNPKTQKSFGMAVWLFGQKVYLAGSRSENGELMVVATNQAPENAIAIYLRRWEIENLFQSLKTRGFRFEETHMTELERIEKLVVLLAIGFCWAHKVGEWRAIKKPIILNKYRKSRRPQYSYFRYGFDLIREAILQTNDLLKRQFKQCIQQITLPDNLLMRVLL